MVDILDIVLDGAFWCYAMRSTPKQAKCQ
jgi:hypothetical protein